MPRRRFRRRARKRKVKNSVMKRRLGILGWDGSRPFTPWSKTLTTITYGVGRSPGTISGTIFHLPVNNWNDPIGPLSNPVAGAGTFTANRHPTNHDTAIANGYNTVQVLEWQLRLQVNWILDAAPTNDFFVAYTFKQDAATEVTMTAGTDSAIERLEIFTSPRWTVKHLRAIQGRSEVHTGKSDIVITVGNVFEYCKLIDRGLNTDAFGNGDVAHDIADVNSVTNPAAVQLFCTIVIMTESGLAMAANAIQLLVGVKQKVKIMRNWPGSQDLDTGEVDVHA